MIYNDRLVEINTNAQWVHNGMFGTLLTLISQDINTYSGFGDPNVEPLIKKKSKMADLNIGVWSDYRSGKLAICCLRKSFSMLFRVARFLTVVIW